VKHLGCILVLSACASTPRAATPPAAPAVATSEVERVEPAIDAFYAKRLRAGGTTILGHASVSDDAFLATRDVLERVLGHAPKLRENLERAKFEVHIVGLRQFASDMPEMRSMRGSRIDTGELFDHHMIGGHVIDRFLVCTEGTLLPIVGYRLFGDETCVHELGHAVELRGMDNAARAKVLAAYEHSIATGHWDKQYASKNVHEWFAEITKYWFRKDRSDLAFYDASLANGHDWLCGYDPDACKLASDVYSGAFDPGAPRTVSIALRPGRDESTIRSEHSHAPMELTIENRSQTRVKLVWIDFDGARDARPNISTWIAPGATGHQTSWRGHGFVLLDDTGRALCTLVTPADDASATFTSPCD
jgi:hypothetical protein